MSRHVDRVFSYFRNRRMVEWLLVVAILVVLIALWLPPVKWASSGTITVPVRVIVFDAAKGTPIPDAQVLIVRAAPAEWEDFMTSVKEQAPGDFQEEFHRPHRSITDAKGHAIINYEFNTGANYEHPVPKAYLRRYWVSVRAPGFGGCVTPVRYESITNSELRKRGELIIPVGLLAQVR